MITQKNLQDAIDWLHTTKKDFAAGVEILSQAGFRPAVTRKLKRDGEGGPDAFERLTWNLRSLVAAYGRDVNIEDTDPVLSVFDGKEAPKEHDESHQLGIMTLACQIEKDEVLIEGENPRKVISEYANAYRSREKAIRLMGEVGEQNDEESMTRRKQLSDEIERHTALMERLYPLYETFESGADISDEDVEKALEINSQTIPDTTSENSAANDSSAAHTSEDLEGKSRDELLKLKKNAQVRLLRTENKLLYQSEKKLEVENPMPPGPERVKLETRVENIKKDIEAIDMAIAKFG